MPDIRMQGGALPEKDDMSCPIGAQRTTGRSPQGAKREAEAVTMGAVGSDVLVSGRGVGDPSTSEWTDGACVELPLRCVSSDPHDGCSCKARIPRAVVEQAWRRELATSGDHEGRFFHLIYDG